MKKLLLGSTALIGASFAASAALAAPQVRVGGYMDFQMGMSSQDTDGFGPAPGVPGVATERGFGFVTDTEIIIRASDKLDNGLAWSVKIELEADADGTALGGTNNNGDEVSLVLSGTWGQLTLGNEDGPVDSKNLQGEAMLSGIGVSGARGYRRWTDTRSFTNGMWIAGADIQNTSDATKVMYYTPTIAGFQFGVSYTADSADNGRSRAADGAAGAGFENWWELGASYEVKVSNDLELGFALAASLADAENQGAAGQEDIRAWVASAMAKFGGFTVSAGYGDDGDSGQTRGRTNDDVSGYVGAVKYQTGPYQVGLSYQRNMAGANAGQTAVTSNTADYTSDTFSLSAQYTLGAGLVMYADTWYFTNDSDGVRPTSENNAIGFLIGTRATF